MTAKEYYNKLTKKGVRQKEAKVMAISTICCNNCSKRCNSVEEMKRRWDLKKVDCPDFIQII